MILSKIPWYLRRSILAAALATCVLSSLTAKEVTFNLETATLEDVQAAMDAGALTSVELVNLYLRRIALYDQNGVPFLNSVMFIRPEALHEAAEADRLRAQGVKLGPLHGIPFLVKGSFALKDMPLTGGMSSWIDLIAPEDTWLVQKMKEAGAIPLGYANMDTFASSAATSSSQVKGAVRSAYVPGAYPGGSSGGSGVSTGANMVFLAFGGETGGSIRHPGDRNGIIANKPSGGVVSVNHILALVPERDVVGPMTRSAVDNAIVMDVVSQLDPDDPWAPILPILTDRRPTPSGFAEAVKDATLVGKKIGIIGTYVGMEHPNPGENATSNTTNVQTIHPDIKTALDIAKYEMERAGATVEYVFLPPQVSTTYNRGEGAPQRLLASAPANTRAAAMAHKSLLEFLLKEPGDTPSTLAKKVIAKAALATYNSGSRAINDATIEAMYTFDDFDQVIGSQAITFDSPQGIQHYTAVQQIKNALEDWMDAEGLDAIVWPTFSNKTPTSGTTIGRDIVNFMHVDGITVPIGKLPTGEPTTLNVTGRIYDDAKTLAIVAAIEKAINARFSAPLAPALPEETFTYSTDSVKPEPPSNVAAPILGVRGRATVSGQGKNAKVKFEGFLSAPAGVSSITVSVNGRAIAAKVKNGKWFASAPAPRFRRMVSNGNKTVRVNALVADANGRTTAQSSQVKLPVNQLL